MTKYLPDNVKMKLAYWKLKRHDFRVLDTLTPDQLIEIRKMSREKGDYETSDYIRDYLDDMNIFIFDTKKDGKPFQEVMYLSDSYFTDYPKGYETSDMSAGKLADENKARKKEWEEKKLPYMDHIAKLDGKKFKSKRDFVEYMIQRDIRANKNLDSWIYTVNRTKNKKK
jgi:hypothetical protein